ncbi:right-handed parallel beta-helix repeat-containing protein, partial [Streptomyces albiflaviniger]|nr:right-handed parallel beta-helix repeat-containing protein [Streptomyces albiflaviniger]
MRLATTIRGLIPVMALAVSAWAVSAPASAEGKGGDGKEGEKAAPVPCGDTAALVNAVSEANSSPSGGSVALTTGCVYTLGSAAFTGANGADGLPLIT